MDNAGFIHSPSRENTQRRIKGAMHQLVVIGAIISLGLSAGSHARADDVSAAQVTSDTPAYCAMLAAKMDQIPDASFDALALGAQGKSLCADGRIRAGIARLRRALLEARDEGGSVSLTGAVPDRSRLGNGDSQFNNPPTVIDSDPIGGGGMFFPPPGGGGGGGGPPGGGGGGRPH